MNTKNENVDTPKGWISRENLLERTITHEKYAKGVENVFKIARIASELNHHPDITLKYSEIVVTTFSHDVGAITNRDVELAEAINSEFGD